MTLKKVSAKKVNIKPKSGTLIIVGGAEDKQRDMEILKEIANRSLHGKLVIVTAATEVADELWTTYKSIFAKLNVKNIDHLYVDQPDDAHKLEKLALFSDATAVFFTGGDQLKITSKLGGSAIIDAVYDIYNRGGLIAGTSAGASVMGKVMLVGGENMESHKIGNWMMAPGLGFLNDVIFDQHFAQRGRIGRLLGAVALNPGILGIGIDEDTAILVQNSQFKVIGKNAVYVIDGRHVSYSNISEREAEKTMSMHDVRLHIMAAGEVYDMKTRQILQVQV
jgi:cyanophycinase